MPPRPALFFLLFFVLSPAVTPHEASAQRVRQGLVSTEDARIFYEVVGDGDPVIVVHGGPGLDHNYLRPGLDILGNRLELAYYDQRGTGRSTTEIGPETINIRAFLDDIEALREALGHDRVHILTHSFGSRIGLAYARSYPERVRSLVLLNPVEPGTRYRASTAGRQTARREPVDSLELASLTTSEGFAAHDPGTMERVFQLAFRAALRDPDQVEELNLALMPATARNGQKIAELLGNELGSQDGWSLLDDVTAPTLVVHGRYDLPPLEMSTELAERLPAGELKILETGHFPFVEDRDALLAVVSGFLVGITGR